MYSSAITRAPVTLFLGAGASKPLGKMVMAEFISSLYTDKTFHSSSLFNQIVQQNPDLEYLFEELEDWAQKGYMERQQASLYRLPPEVLRHARELLVALRQKVFNAYKEIEDLTTAIPKLTELLDGIFSTLDEQRYPLVVFTTNYDPAIETYCTECKSYALEDGFAQEDGALIWRRERFANFQLPGSKKNIVLFKLHGSATWVKKGGRTLKLPFPIYAGQERDFDNVLIYPARKKVALDDPFATAYDYFQRTMDVCGCCIVIGYSFRDYDALTKLMSASAFNPHLRVLVIDPNSEKLCRDLSSKGIRCTGVPQRFGEDIKFMQQVSEHVGEAVRTQQPSENTQRTPSAG